MLVVLSLLASYYLVIILGLSANYPFARYAYPVAWVSYVSFALVVILSAPQWILWLVLASLAVPTGNLWYPKDNPLSLWPKFMSRELYYTADTVHQGVPLNAWVLMTPFTRQKMHGYFPTTADYQLTRAVKYLEMNTTKLESYTSEKKDNFLQATDGKKIVFRRQFLLNGDEPCANYCEGENYSLQTCTKFVEWPNKPGTTMISQSCLP